MSENNKCSECEFGDYFCCHKCKKMVCDLCYSFEIEVNLKNNKCVMICNDCYQKRNE